MIARHLHRLALAAAMAVACLSASQNSAQAQGQPLIFAGPCGGYLPVCARQGSVLVTYMNSCVARQMGGRIVSNGACPVACPMVFQPVCAADSTGKRTTFGNECQAKTAGAKIVRRGRCLPRMR